MDPSEGYQEALAELKRRYGNPHRICQAWLQKMLNRQKVTSTEELVRFSDELNICRRTLNHLGGIYLQEISSLSSLRRLIEKLPTHLQQRWLRVNHRIVQADNVPTIDDVIKFVSSSAQERTDVVFGDLCDNMQSKVDKRQSNVKRANVKSSKNVRSFTTQASHSPAPPVNTPSANSAPSKKPCVSCGEDHFITKCDGFKGMAVKQRQDFAKEKRLCLNCLHPGHFSRDCLRTFVCNIDGCGQRHNRMLHLPRPNNSNAAPVQAPNAAQANATPTPPIHTVANHAVRRSGHILLPILPVWIKGPDGKRVQSNVLLDSGSSQTMCSNDVLAKLNVPCSTIETKVNTTAGSYQSTFNIFDLTVESLDGTTSIPLKNVLSQDSLNISQNEAVSIDAWEHLEDIPLMHSHRPVQLLIGQDAPEALIPLEIVSGVTGSPYAIKTVFGWTLSGPTQNSLPTSISINYARAEIDQQIHELWRIEKPRERNPYDLMTAAEKEVISHWNNTAELIDGKYTLDIPFKQYPPSLKNNKAVAQHRLELLSRKLQKEEKLKDLYVDGIENFISKGFAEKVSDDQKSNEVWYLPHHAVVNPRKPGKVRPVFDCAAKYAGVSLNDQVNQGPDLTNSLISVLLKFRKYEVATSADIEGMFNHVKVPDKHRDFLRFLWFKDVKSMNAHDPVVYRMTTHLFGGVWSSCAANYALHKCVEDSIGEVKNTVLNDFYVDDWLKSTKTEEEAIQIAKDTVEALKQGGFKLTKFVSNKPSVIKSIPEDLRAESSTLKLDDPLSNITERALGVCWQVDSDNLQVYTASASLNQSNTKRGLLSSMSSIYDPLGIVSPYVLRSRMLFQAICKRQLGWDEEIPEDILSQWRSWISDLPLLDSYVIPRCLIPTQNEENIQLHVFCDASLCGYGAVSYLRIEEDNLVHTSFVMSKAKVAPLKATTIPRLELQAACEAAKMKATVINQLGADNIKDVYMWTDSMIVLWYLRKNDEKHYQTYVANRVADVLDLTIVQEWRHVPTSQNPADHASRGMTAKDLLHSSWKDGPDFLRKKEDEWPEEPYINPPTQPEVKKEAMIYATDVSSMDPLQRHSSHHPLDILINRYSSWNALKRAVAALLKVKSFLRKQDISPKITLAETNRAEELILKQAQSTIDISTYQKLSPYHDDDGLLRVGGRITHAPLPLDVKHQILLPATHPVTSMLVREYHMKVGHGGVNRTLFEIRSRFWVSRKSLKGVVHKCIPCKKLFGKPLNQLMADLPPDRITPSPPFTNTGVDFFGPFPIKRGRSEVKRYICLFTCLVVRAVHLEVSFTLEADSFINALQRFMARRGSPSLIRSDNGTNFTGAQTELKNALEELQKSKKLSQFALDNGIKWTFNTPYASHQGGVWERQIRSVRRIMKGLMDSQRLDDEGLYTLVTTVENIMNSRPLTPLSEDINDLSPLTPNHILLMREGPSGLPGDYVKQDVYLSKRWRQVQYISDEFWRRWLKEYIPCLQERQKWLKVHENVKVGDLVLMMETCPRGQWPLGRVINTKVSIDGLVRSATVRTKTGVYERPIHKLVLVMHD